MACKCTNKDGTLSDKCNGTCSIKHKIVEMESQSRDPLNGFGELILSQVEKRIDYRLAKFHLEIHDDVLEDYKKAFIDGIKEGMRLAREEDY